LKIIVTFVPDLNVFEMTELIVKNDIEKKKIIKADLLCNLIEWRAFWSYPPDSVTIENISDEMLIEKTLVHLDIDDINKLFTVFPSKKIKDVWKQRLCTQEPYFHGLNVMLACLYFDIKNPERYIKIQSNRHLKSLKHKADEWFGKTYGENF
jgi:hypothetical protein